MRRILGHIILVASVIMSTNAPAENQYENDIRAFEAADRVQPPPTNAVLFIGSSTIRLWETAQSDFPDVVLFNRGFGGATVPDVLHFMDRTVIPYRPRMIVFYDGDNDLAHGSTPEQVVQGIREFVSRVHEKLPATQIIILCIKPSPQRWSLADKAKAVNAELRAMAEKDPRLKYVDVFNPMLGKDGLPRPELYVEDGLHMSPAGYQLWREILRPYLR
jgi:lysophospholipase L1-like esterase